MKPAIQTELDTIIRTAMGTAIKEACLQVMSDNAVWDEIQGFVEDWLETTHARLSFFDGEPVVSLFVGDEGRDRNVALKDFPVNFCDITTYVNARDADKEEMTNQVRGIDTMIDQLVEFRARLTRKIVK